MILDTDVFGEPAPQPIKISLSIKGGLLNFAPEFPESAKTVVGAAPGEFFEGLWKGDVAELFLSLPNGNYVEYNFAPNGAWWACAFSEPRVRTTRKVPREIPAEFALGNVTAIIGGRYLTHFPLGGKQPDFHRPQDFRKLL